MCPYYLDGDRTLSLRALRHRTDWFGDTRRRRAYRHDDDVATVQFSRAAGRRPAGLAGRSLKTQQHAPARGARDARLAGPGSVDVLGRTVGGRRVEQLAGRPEGRQGERPATTPCRTGPLVRGSLERR
jgi:hypothetical protein